MDAPKMPPFYAGERLVYRDSMGEERIVHFMMLSIAKNPPGAEQTAIVLDENDQRMVVRIRDLRPAK